MLSYCNFYLKEWISFDQNHKTILNKDLPKEGSASNILRERPPVDETHREIRQIQNTQNSVETELIKEEKTFITPLERNLSQDTYSVKNKTVEFQIKQTKINFKTFEEAEQYLTNNNITKRQLCSLMHSFYDLRNAILCQTILMSITTWKYSMTPQNLNGMS